MAILASPTMSLPEFLTDYGGENGYEYWFGEAVFKGMTTRKHNLLQRVFEDLLRANGYRGAISEVDLCVDPDWRPRPDVIGAFEPEDPYQITIPPLVIEVLSPTDQMSRVFKKCRQYVRIGVPQIFVFDPESRDCWEWNKSTDNLERIQELHLESGVVISIQEIWRRLEERLAE